MYKNYKQMDEQLHGLDYELLSNVQFCTFFDKLHIWKAFGRCENCNAVLNAISQQIYDKVLKLWKSIYKPTYVFPHLSQVWGLSPVCCLTCCCMFTFCVNVFPHTSHIKRRPSLCTFICDVKPPLVWSLKNNSTFFIKRHKQCSLT